MLETELPSAEAIPKKKSMRYNHFMDLFGTETNYVGILHTIVSVWKNIQMLKKFI